MAWRKCSEDSIHVAARSFGKDFYAFVSEPCEGDAMWRGSITIWGRVAVGIFDTSELTVKRRLGRILSRWAGDIHKELGKDDA